MISANVRHTAEMADQMNMPARTIRHWLARGSAPDFCHRWSRSQTHLGGPFQASLLERWHQGCRNVLQLERELRSLGYKGSRRSLYRMVATFAPVPTAKALTSGIAFTYKKHLVPYEDKGALGFRWDSWTHAKGDSL